MMFQMFCSCFVRAAYVIFFNLVCLITSLVGLVMHPHSSAIGTN